MTIVKKPQCTKSLGPNQPQNLKLRLCIWQQGSLFLILSYPGLFKNIPHVWFLRLYSFLKNPQYDFPKMRGGGSKAVWNFSENSSVLVGGGFPYLWRIEQLWYSGKEQNRELTLLFEPKNPLPGGIQCVANAMRLNPKFYFKVWYTRP